jgi:hypothetical protein
MGRNARSEVWRRGSQSACDRPGRSVSTWRSARSPSMSSRVKPITRRRLEQTSQPSSFLIISGDQRCRSGHDVCACAARVGTADLFQSSALKSVIACTSCAFMLNGVLPPERRPWPETRSGGRRSRVIAGACLGADDGARTNPSLIRRLVIPCPVCLTGMADIVAVSPPGDLRQLTYQCAACNHQFDIDA